MLWKELYQCKWHLSVVLPPQFSENGIAKGEVILETFSLLSEKVFGTSTVIFIVWVSFICCSFQWWNGRKPLFLLSFVYLVMHFGSSLCVVFFYHCFYTTCSMRGPSAMYTWKFFHEYRFNTKFNNRNLSLLLTNATNDWFLFAKNFKSLL